VLAAGQLRGFAEEDGCTLLEQPVDDVADRGAGREPGGRVGLAALDAERQLGEIDGLTLELGGLLDERLSRF